LPGNHAEESSTANVKELRYAAREAEDEASTPELMVVVSSADVRSAETGVLRLTSSDMIQSDWTRHIRNMKR
jgi:hypothetical protein